VSRLHAATIISAALLVGGCCSTTYRPLFSLDLHTPASDEVSFSVRRPDRSLVVDILNKTSEEVQVDWPSATFVDFEGDEGAVLDAAPASGLVAKPVTTIPAGGMVSERVHPRTLMTAHGRFFVQPMMGGQGTRDRAAAEQFLTRHAGTPATLRLPIIRGGIRKTYTLELIARPQGIERFCGV
jgi:hypothetical protein